MTAAPVSYTHLPTQTEQATVGTEVKTPFSLTKSYGFVAQIVTEAPVDMTITVYDLSLIHI